MSAFLLKAKKVLVISSSTLVRGQITQEFSELSTLKKLGVLEESTKALCTYNSKITNMGHVECEYRFIQLKTF